MLWWRLWRLPYLDISACVTAINESEKTTYEIINVEKGTIEVKVKGAGAVEPLQNTTAYAPYACTVDQVLAEDGDFVKVDDVVAILESNDLKAQKDTLIQQIDDADKAIATLRSTEGSAYILAPVSGTIKALYAADGDSVDVVMQTYGALAVICPDDMLDIVFGYDKEPSPGDVVTVTSGEDSFSGVIYSVDANNGEAIARFESDSAAMGDEAAVTAEGGEKLGSGLIGVVNPIYVTGHGGTVDKVYKETGDSISRGRKLFHLDGDRLSEALYAQIDQRAQLDEELSDVIEKLDALIVRAGSDGVVADIDLNEDQAVQSGAALFTIKSSAQIKIDVDIDELDISDIQTGQDATVTFDAIPDKVFTATVSKINPVGISENDVTQLHGDVGDKRCTGRDAGNERRRGDRFRCGRKRSGHPDRGDSGH